MRGIYERRSHRALRARWVCSDGRPRQPLRSDGAARRGGEALPREGRRPRPRFGRYVERPARGLSRHSFSSQAVEPVSQRPRAPADRRDADVSDGPQCQMHAVDAVHQACGQAGAGVASGRGFHSDPRPLVDRGLDRSRRRNDRQRLPVGDPRLPPFGRALAAAPTCQSRVRLRSRNPSIFRTKRAMRGQSRSRWGRSFSSTATCCTNR